MVVVEPPIEDSKDTPKADNVAFVSTPSSTNDVNTSNVHVSTASSSLSTASTTDNTASLSDATIYAFLANQPNGSNFAPTVVLTKSGLVPISAASQNSSRTAATVSAARPIKTVAPKPFVNVAKSRTNAFQKSHLPSRRPFYQQTTLKNRNNKVNTVKENFVNTAKGKRVTSAVGEQGIDDVKSKACWVWRPKLKVLDHDSNNSGSYICKQFDYVDPTSKINWGEDIEVSMNILSVLVVYHTTNSHQFTMSNRHQELASPEQTVSGKDFLNPLIVDSLLKTIWFINAPCFCNKALAIPGQTATGKEFSNPLMADSLPKTILSTKFLG
ncbi:hypothetical protein Tco_0562112 [Tanacetum coccineum]